MSARYGRVCLAMVCCISTMPLAAGLAGAMPPKLTPALLIDLCRSETIAEATVKGDQLGWERVPATDPLVEEWRRSFMSYNGGSVDVTVWRAGKNEEHDRLSFWVAQGPNGGKACSYGTTTPEGLLDTLTGLLGAPISLDRNEITTTAAWKRDSMEVYYSQVGSRAQVAISH